jgi:hypothetical protein
MSNPQKKTAYIVLKPCIRQNSEKWKLVPERKAAEEQTSAAGIKPLVS